MNSFKNNENHLVLIDGYGFVFRAYHSLPPLTREDGTPIGAVYGFTSMLLKVISELHASHFAIVFDSGAKSFRNEIYSQYKANRPPAPEDLLPQFPLVRDVADALNIKVIEKIGYEADDLIATFARKAHEQGLQVTIISSDKDLMQLVGEDIKMFDPMKSKIIDREEVFKKFGLYPEKILDALSLIGDTADNIPGVPGIGPKTAAELITKYGSLDNLQQNLEDIKQPKRRQTLIDNKEQALLSRTLLTLDENVETEVKLEDLVIKVPEDEKVVTFLEKQGFRSLINKLRLTNSKRKIMPSSFVKKQQKSILLTEEQEIRDKISLAKSAGKIAFYLQESSPDQYIIAFCLDKETSYIIQPSPNATQQELIPSSANNNITTRKLKEIIEPIFADNSILKISYNIKNLFHFFSLDIHDCLIDDVMLMSYSLDNGRHNHEIIDLIKTCFPSTFPKEELARIDLAEQAAEIVSYISQIHLIFHERLIKESVYNFYQRIERPLSEVLYYMEKRGIKVDTRILASLSKEFTLCIKELELEIYKLAGQKFNIGSPKQLAEILFEHMNIEYVGKLSKTKSKSTNAEILEELSAAGHTIADYILKWRHYSKLKGTYIEALQRFATPTAHRIHSTFQMAITSTGRLSSTDPNLQNIPIRSEEGMKIRSCFITEPGYKLISADYSQIELRLLAHMANVTSLKEAFIHKQDIHATTAREIFNIEEVTPDHRRKAKAINFGIIYGISAFGLANQLKISRNEAKEYIDRYYEKYPEIKAYMENTKEFARKNGYVKTLLGRKIFIKTINDKNHAIRSFAERAAINAPLQGSNSDIIKKAMIKIHRIFRQQNLNANIILQIHDELLIEADEKHCNTVTNIVKTCMENIVMLDIPVTVEVGIGQNWAEIH